MATPRTAVRLILLIVCITSMQTGLLGGERRDIDSQPKNADDYPAGYWFGTQNLLCVMGVTGSASSSGRRRRAVAPSSGRSPYRFAHRLLYYRGALYEWGTGSLGYYIGATPSVVECPLIWEDSPTGNSTCEPADIKQFTFDYRSRYGVYNIVTNNCHHFANRVSELLASPSCAARPTRWSHVTRAFWRYLGRLLAGDNLNTDVRLHDVNDVHDRTAIN